MIVTLSGKNDYAIREELNRMTQQHRQTFGDLTFHNIDLHEQEFEQLSEAVLSVPFLASQSMVVVHGLAGNKSVHDSFIQLVDDIPDTTTVVVAEPKLDKRSALYKVLSSRTDYREQNQLDPNQLSNWVKDQFVASETEVDGSVANYLIERAGENQWILSSEIKKLSSVSQPITRSLIDSMVEAHPRETIFQLLDAVSAHNQREALNVYRKLVRARIEPHYIMSMLVWQLNNMNIVKHAEGANDMDITRKHKMSPYVVQKTRQAVSHISKQDINRMWRELLKVDRKLKSSSVDDDLSVEQLVVKLAA